MKRLIVAAVALAALAGQAQAATPKKAGAGGAAAHGWTYTDTTNPMGARTLRACTTAHTLAKLAFPYKPTAVRLCLDYFTPDADHHRTTASLRLAGKGQFTGDFATFKFDGATVLGSEGYTSDDNSVLFLMQDARIVRRLLRSKTALVEVRFFQNGTQYFEFDTANLKFPGPELDMSEQLDRDEELRAAGNDPARIAAINAKYDCIAHERTDCEQAAPKPAPARPSPPPAPDNRKPLASGKLPSGPGNWDVIGADWDPAKELGIYFARLEANETTTDLHGQPRLPRLEFVCSFQGLSAGIVWPDLTRNSTVVWWLDDAPPQTSTWSTGGLGPSGPVAQKWIGALMKGHRLALQVNAEHGVQKTTFDIDGIDKVGAHLLSLKCG